MYVINLDQKITDRYPYSLSCLKYTKSWSLVNSSITLTLEICTDTLKLILERDTLSCLTNRQFVQIGKSIRTYFVHQFVQIDDKSTKKLPVYFGVPQSSILGSILFNLFIWLICQIRSRQSRFNMLMTQRSTSHSKKQINPYEGFGTRTWQLYLRGQMENCWCLTVTSYNLYPSRKLVARLMRSWCNFWPKV